MRLEFCNLLQNIRKLFTLIHFTGEASITRNAINNTRNFHRWSHYNPCGSVETNIERRFSISLWCGMFDYILIGTVILDCHMEGIN